MKNVSLAAGIALLFFGIGTSVACRGSAGREAQSVPTSPAPSSSVRTASVSSVTP